MNKIEDKHESRQLNNNTSRKVHSSKTMNATLRVPMLVETQHATIIQEQKRDCPHEGTHINMDLTSCCASSIPMDRLQEFIKEALDGQV